MHFGQYLFGKTKVFGPWTTRRGDNGIFTYEVISAEGGGSIAPRIFHKNSEDPGPGAEISATFAEVDTSTTIFEATVSGLKELVRYQFDAEEAGTANVWLLYRTLPTVWFDTPNA